MCVYIYIYIHYVERRGTSRRNHITHKSHTIANTSHIMHEQSIIANTNNNTQYDNNNHDKSQ